MSGLLDTAGNLDPTGVLTATTAAVRLVGTVLNVKKSLDQRKDSDHATHSAGYGAREVENDVTGASTSSPSPATAAQIQSLALQRVNPERETRAYETLNFVLKTVGSRILEAKMVNMDALAKALISATEHIEVKLFSGETNRLFQSLARRLNDGILVNSVFTSIYLIGFLTAELSSSLPNYKKEYPALGPVLIQQIMRAAIGEDAFRENQTANLNAYHTVATTAGLLRPTDIGYSIFPDFPSFAPTRYSSNAIFERSSHKGALEKLVKHFDQHGFPQPLQGRDVGPIRDWRFLAGDTNSRAYEVEKADKQIGLNFGRVLYWLICSANRMPSGMAVIGYFDQHIALVRFLGHRFGYRVLNAGGDLNMSGAHLQMNKKMRATFDTWVLVMPSETLINERRKVLETTNQGPAPAFTKQPQATSPPPVAAAAVAHSPPPQNVKPNIPQSNNTVPIVVPNATTQSHPHGGVASAVGHQSIGSEASSQGPKPGANTNPQRSVSQPQPQSPNIGLALQQLNELESKYLATHLPQCNQFIASPPTEADALRKEHTRLTENLQVEILFKVDALNPGSNEVTRMERKNLVDDVQALLARLDNVYREASKVTSPPSRPSSMASVPSLKPTLTSDQSFPTTETGPAELAAESISEDGRPDLTSSTTGSGTNTGIPTKLDTMSSSSPPLYDAQSPLSASPITTGTPSTPITTPSGAPSFHSRPPSILRRKAPPPPKRVILATAIYDFEGGDEAGEELTFSEGDIIEIVEKNQTLEEDGWCRARVKGQKQIGLAPLDYLEELPNQPTWPPTRSSRMSSMTASAPIIEQSEAQDTIPTPAASISDIKIDNNVSVSSHSSHTIPNATSPTTQPMSPPNLNQVQIVVGTSANAGPPLPLPDQPPPPYTSSTNPASQNQPGNPPAATNAGMPTEQIPAGQISTGQTGPGPNMTSGGYIPPSGSYKPPGSLPSGYRPPSSQPTGYRPPNGYRPPIQDSPMAGPGGPIGGSSVQYISMGGPGTQNNGRSSSDLGASAQFAQALSGFAQAGASLFSTTHGHSNHQSNNDSNPIEPRSNDATGGTTYIYNDNDSNNDNNNSNNNNNNNNNNYSNTSNDNNNNQSTSNSTTNVDSTQNTSNNSTQDTSIANDPITNNNQFYSVPSDDFNNYDYTIPYYPPETTTSPDYDLNSTYFPQSSPAGTVSPTDPATANVGSSSTSNPNLYATAPVSPVILPTTDSGPTSDPSIYATAPPSDLSQYTYDPSSMYGNTSTAAPSDPTTSPFNTDITGGVGTDNPLAGLSLPAESSTSPFDSSITGDTGTVSPFADLSSPADPTQFNFDFGNSSGMTSPFASLVSPPDTTTGSTWSSDNSQSFSPFASMATPDPTQPASQSGGDSGTATSPFASLAVTDTSSTTDLGYFSASVTSGAASGTVTPDAISPLAGLASSSTVDTTTVTTTTTTDTQTSFEGGSGTDFTDQSSFNMTSLSTTGFDSSSITGGGGGWSSTDFTTTDSSSYACDDSFDY